jgi:hypothetical protein
LSSPYCAALIPAKLRSVARLRFNIWCHRA